MAKLNNLIRRVKCMGARAQVHIQDNGVYLYTHWGSGSIIEDVQTALASDAGRNRLTDPDYLARIIFDVLKDGDTTGETGFGIGTSQLDGNDCLVSIDCAKRQVTVSWENWDTGETRPVEYTHSVDDFLLLQS
jgi:hypothetical protein